MLIETEKLKRQAEILGLCLRLDRKEITIPDLSELFDVSIPTIDRDLQDMRSLGIPIHSQKGLGVIVDRNNNHKIIESVLLNYISVCHSENLADVIGIGKDSGNISLLLEIFVKLRLAIETTKKIKIKWYDSKDSESITPVQVIMKANKWYLIYITEEYVTVENLHNIKEIEITNDNAKKVRIEKMNSLLEKTDSYLITDIFTIRVTFSEGNPEFFAPRGLKILSRKNINKNMVEIDGVCADLNTVIVDLFENYIDYSMKILKYDSKSCREIAKTRIELIEKDDNGLDMVARLSYIDKYTPRATKNLTTSKVFFDKVRIDKDLAEIRMDAESKIQGNNLKIIKDNKDKDNKTTGTFRNLDGFVDFDSTNKYLQKEDMEREKRLKKYEAQKEGKIKKFFKFIKRLFED